MKLLQVLCRFALRFRYPVSLPEDVAEALGIKCTHFLTLHKLVCLLTDPSCCAKNLSKFMSRQDAEQVFRDALRKERFLQNSLFSYYFNGTWMEFVLQFDEQSRLRRLYLTYKDLDEKREIRISK